MNRAALLERTDLELLNEIAERARLSYDISTFSRIKLLRYGEATEYLVEDPQNGLRTVLQIRSAQIRRDEIESEIFWMQELNKYEQIAAPEPIAGINGKFVQTIRLPLSDSEFYCIMYSFVSAISLLDCDGLDMISRCAVLGETASLLHQNALQWNHAPSFLRPVPEWESVLNEQHSFPFAGWPQETLFSRTLHRINSELNRYGRSPRRFGLIHAGLSPENVYQYKKKTAVSHFESCCFGWYLYDCGAALNSHLHKPEARACISAWLAGYRRHRNITKDDRMILPSLLLLYRLTALSQNSDSAAGDPENTAALCERYLLSIPKISISGRSSW